MLTLIGLRSRSPAVTASLSAFTQSVGYLVAGTGPLLVGVLHDADGGWTSSLVLLLVAVAVMAVAGWRATAAGSVEDDLPAR